MGVGRWTELHGADFDAMFSRVGDWLDALFDKRPLAHKPCAAAAKPSKYAIHQRLEKKS